MRRPQYTLTATAVQHHAAALVQHYLRLRDHGPKCTTRTLLSVLFYAAARLTSLAAACTALRRAPSDQAVRDALRATLPPLYDLPDRLNRALAAHLLRALRRRRQPLAIDLTLLPYHGLPCYLPEEIYRGRAKSGTSHFHAYATAYVVRRGQRFTVALDYVLRGEALPDVLRGLLHQAARYPFLMPAPCRGSPADHAQGPGGPRVFHLWKRGGWSRHVLRDAQGRTATVGICVKCRNYRGAWRRHGRQALVYAYGGLRPSSGQWVYQTYRLRFGIETTYRQLRQARIATATRDPVLRWLFVGLALLLRTVWVWLHGEVLSHPRRGGRRFDLDQLPFRAMLLWLQHVAEALLESVDDTHADHPIPK
jgi:putative transposase